MDNVWPLSVQHTCECPERSCPHRAERHHRNPECAQPRGRRPVTSDDDCVTTAALREATCKLDQMLASTSDFSRVDGVEDSHLQLSLNASTRRALPNLIANSRRRPRKVPRTVEVSHTLNSSTANPMFNHTYESRVASVLGVQSA